MPSCPADTPATNDSTSARSTSLSGATGRRLVNANAPAGIRPPTGKRRERRPTTASTSGKRATSASAARSCSPSLKGLFGDRLDQGGPMPGGEFHPALVAHGGQRAGDALQLQQLTGVAGEVAAHRVAGVGGGLLGGLGDHVVGLGVVVEEPGDLVEHAAGGARQRPGGARRRRGGGCGGGDSTRQPDRGHTDREVGQGGPAGARHGNPYKRVGGKDRKSVG